MLENSGNRRTLFSSNEKNNLPSELLIEAVKTINVFLYFSYFIPHVSTILKSGKAIFHAKSIQKKEVGTEVFNSEK